MNTEKLYEPMLAKSSPPFSGEDWIFEIKWDGTRALCYVNETATFYNRRKTDITHRYPELTIAQNCGISCILDGEIIVLKNGLPSFRDLQKREQVDNAFKITLLSENIPAVYVVFDILAVDGQDIINTPLMERKSYINHIVSESPRLMICPYIEGKGDHYYNAVTEKGFEGVMAKRKDSLYFPGKRSGAWLKIKKTKTVDCVIGGFTEGEGNRKEYFGALLLGVNPFPLAYVGKVGTGFSDEQIKTMYSMLKGIETHISPFSENVPIQKIHYVNPVTVCEVKYQEITNDKKLRAPVFLRLRTDKPPEDCVLNFE
ncbi:MAG: non-homologous end-joining DNA ligase [Candidatus Methanofastidiosia archaeon]|jgi:bifunctional non-homologous end joining protein LigD